MSFSKHSGRLTVEVNDEGLKMQDYVHGAKVICRAGWNDSCPMVAHTISVDELRDLHYMIGRAIEAALSPSKEIVQPPGGWPPMNGRGF